LLVDGDLYMVSDRGILSCVNAKSGEVRWQGRLRGNFSASPVYAAGRIYLLNESGEATVIAPGASMNVLATSKLPGGTLASPAFSEGAMFLRTSTHLYRIEPAK